GIRDSSVTGVQTCALPIFILHTRPSARACFWRLRTPFLGNAGAVFAPDCRLPLDRPIRGVTENYPETCATDCKARQTPADPLGQLSGQRSFHEERTHNRRL